MNAKKSTMATELFWFVLAVLLSFSIWCGLTALSDQTLIVDSHRYSREVYGFAATVGFIYFLRLSGKWVNPV